MSKYSSQSASICCLMSLWHVDMKTEGVNGKLLLLALAHDSSDISSVLPCECEAQHVLKQHWARFLGLRLPGSLHCWLVGSPLNLEFVCNTDIPTPRVKMRIFSWLHDSYFAQ